MSRLTVDLLLNLADNRRAETMRTHSIINYEMAYGSEIRWAESNPLRHLDLPNNKVSRHSAADSLQTLCPWDLVCQV
jgi:hypothetical protein